MKLRATIVSVLALLSGFAVLGAGHLAAAGATQVTQPTPFTCADNQPAVFNSVTNLYACTVDDPHTIVLPASVTPSATAQTTAASTLPFTGGDVAGLAAVGLTLLALGAVLVRRNRHRSTESA